MERFRTDEAIEKARQTRLNNLPQVATPDDQETHINVDYTDQVVYVYTTMAKVMNRMARREIEYDEQEMVDGEVFSRSYLVSWKDFSKVASVGLFK